MSGDILKRNPTTADNIAYTLRAYALALRNIAPVGRNVVYAGTVRRNFFNIGYRGMPQMYLTYA